jgi:Integrase core domain
MTRGAECGLEVSGVRTLYIEPGAPWENAYSETFISRFGDELLKREVFADLLEAKVLVEDYREYYNHNRPHSALDYQTPAEFVAATDLGSKEETEELGSVLIPFRSIDVIELPPPPLSTTSSR